jgi:CRP-like cAMP-binding protein
MPAKFRHPVENQLLSALPAEEYKRLLPSLQPVTLRLGEVLYDAGGPLDHVYFPTTAVISLLYTMQDGVTAEIGLTGNEGVVCVAVFLGGNTAPNQAVVQIAGNAVRMKAAIVRQEFARGGSFQHLLLNYTRALLIQISQTAVCNRLHSVEQRLCRWILMSHDRAKSDELVMTQEFISKMLGGRRESVSLAAQRLQNAGIIRYVRGHITILDRKRLEARVCECYRVEKDETARLVFVAEQSRPRS